MKLKFIVHTGEISLAKFNTGTSKPYGTPVITVHRLLKNKIGLSEYILFSNDALHNANLTLDGSGSYEDKELGIITFQYSEINDWKPEVLFNDDSRPVDEVDIEVEASTSVSAPADLLHEFISDFRYRHYWNKDAEKVVFDEEHMNTAGTEHYCIVNGKDFFFDTIKPKADEGKWSYGEVLKNPAPMKYLESNFYMSSINEEETHLRFVLRASVKWKLQILMLPIIKRKLQQKTDEVLAAVSTSIEKHIEELKRQPAA